MTSVNFIQSKGGLVQKIIKNYPPTLLSEVVLLPVKLAKLEYYAARKIKPEKIGFGKDPKQYFIFFEPLESLPRKKQVVCFYHGGGWRLGFPGMFPAVSEFFLRLGFPVVMPCYRKTPQFSYLEMREDLNLAWHSMQGFLSKRGIPGEQIIVGGMSAGANLAAHLVFDRESAQRNGIDQKRISGFISCGGPLDLFKMADTFPLADFTGGKFGSEAFQRASPMTYLVGNEQVPSFFVHGTADRIVPVESAFSFFEKLKTSSPAEFVSLPGKKHIDSLGWAADDFPTAEKLANWLAGL